MIADLMQFFLNSRLISQSSQLAHIQQDLSDSIYTSKADQIFFPCLLDSNWSMSLSLQSLVGDIADIVDNEKNCWQQDNIFTVHGYQKDKGCFSLWKPDYV